MTIAGTWIPPIAEVLIQQELHAVRISNFRSRSAANARPARIESSYCLCNPAALALRVRCVFHAGEGDSGFHKST